MAVNGLTNSGPKYLLPVRTKKFMLNYNNKKSRVTFRTTILHRAAKCGKNYVVSEICGRTKVD